MMLTDISTCAADDNVTSYLRYVEMRDRDQFGRYSWTPLPNVEAPSFD